MDFQNLESSVASRQASAEEQTARWESIVAMTAQTFRFTPEETIAFASCRTARLIGELPFIARCEDAERTALAHLAVYITALRGGRFVFDHSPEDNEDICSRLRLIMSFESGVPLVIEHGMKLLALIMVCGYNRDREKDEAEGFYNPLNDGSWDFAKISSILTARIKEISSPAIERLLPLASGPTAIWY
jgi:predicted N-acyltransferase